MATHRSAAERASQGETRANKETCFLRRSVMKRKKLSRSASGVLDGLRALSHEQRSQEEGSHEQGSREQGSQYSLRMNSTRINRVRINSVRLEHFSLNAAFCPLRVRKTHRRFSPPRCVNDPAAAVLNSVRCDANGQRAFFSPTIASRDALAPHAITIDVRAKHRVRELYNLAQSLLSLIS